MHEVGLAQEIVAIVERHAAGARVTRVVVEVGRLAAVVPDALRFAFELCREGTVADQAVLDIVEVPGRATCRRCGRAVELDRPYGRCACGSSDLDWLSGDELSIRTMEVT